MDVKTGITLPTIGDVEDAIQGKQATISDNGLSTLKISGLDTTLTTLSTDISQNETDITTLNKNNIIFNSNEYRIRTASKWISRTIPTTGTGKKIVYAPELNLFVSIKLGVSDTIGTSGNIMTPSNGTDWEIVINDLGGCNGLNWASMTTSPNTNTPKSIVWSSELNIFVIVNRTGAERVAYSSNGDDWFNVIVSLNEWNDIAWSPQLELFVAVAETGDNRFMTSTDGINWIDGTIPLYLWESVKWSEFGFIIATAKDGYILYSNDGSNWIDSVLSGSLYGGCCSKELGIFVIVRLDIIYTSSLMNRKPTNDNVFNNEFNSIDENGTWTFNSLNTNSISLNGSSVSTLRKW